MLASTHVSTLKLWNRHQSKIRKSLMDEYRGVLPITNLELRIKTKELDEKLDRSLLNFAVLREFNKLYEKDLK